MGEIKKNLLVLCNQVVIYGVGRKDQVDGVHEDDEGNL
jgi:hypothetical protein